MCTGGALGHLHSRNESGIRSYLQRWQTSQLMENGLFSPPLHARDDDEAFLIITIGPERPG